MDSNNSSTDSKFGISEDTLADRVYRDGAWHSKAEAKKLAEQQLHAMAPPATAGTVDTEGTIAVRLRLEIPMFQTRLQVKGIHGAFLDDAHAKVTIAVADLDDTAAYVYAEKLRKDWLLFWDTQRNLKQGKG